MNLFLLNSRALKNKQLQELCFQKNENTLLYRLFIVNSSIISARSMFSEKQKHLSLSIVIINKLNYFSKNCVF